MNVLIAMLVDSYRELNSKKLFWITMILSGMMVVLFMMLGIDQNGMKLSLGFTEFRLPVPITTDDVSEEVFLKQYFIQLGINFWLAWVATILALCTTAEMFPNMMSNGAIDMMLSKPVRRLSIFAGRYFSGLLFTALQVFVFTFLSFLVIGFKSGAWEPGLFIAVPLTVIFFSYLFGICVLVGVLTRSTIASLLVTLLVWGAIFLVNIADGVAIVQQASYEARAESEQAAAEREGVITARLEEQVESATDPERQAGFEDRLKRAIDRRDSFIADAERAQQQRDDVDNWHKYVLGVKWVLPKTGETIGLIERWLIDLADLLPENEPETDNADLDGDDFDADEVRQRVAREANRQLQEDIQRKTQEKVRGRSWQWIIGTSLLFELFVVGIAAWLFQRRDF